MITFNGKEHVIIQQHDKINVIINQMIIPNEKKYVIIQPDENINGVILLDGTSITILAQSWLR